MRERLNESLNAKLYEVEKKREKGILLDKKIAKLPDGQERRKLIYQKQQQDNYNRRHKKFPIDEERALHESYQIIMKVNQNIENITLTGWTSWSRLKIWKLDIP